MPSGLAPEKGLAAFVIASAVFLAASSCTFYVRLGSFIAVAVASFVTDFIAVPIRHASGQKLPKQRLSRLLIIFFGIHIIFNLLFDLYF